jgi:hypothetical protein
MLWVSNDLACTEKYAEAKGSVPVHADTDLTLELPETGSIRENSAILESVDVNALSGLKVAGANKPAKSSESEWFLKVLNIAASWNNLDSLTLDYCSTNEAILNALNNLKNVHNLKLAHCVVDAAALARRPIFHRLETLIISNFSAEGILKRSSNLTNLKGVSLDHCEVSANLLNKLRKCPKLEYLAIDESKIDDQEIRSISQLENLQTLVLKTPLPTVAQIEILRGCPSLKNIMFNRFYVSEMQIERLRKLDSRIQLQ